MRGKQQQIKYNSYNLVNIGIFFLRECALLELGIMTKNDGNALGILSPKKVCIFILINHSELLDIYW